MILSHQVEMELGLFEDAAENFLAASREDEMKAIAIFGLGQALLFMARRDAEDGKAGAALSHLQKAVQSCDLQGRNFRCLSKLRGDLYTCGALLPAGVFVGSEVDTAQNCCDKQLAFINEGIVEYSAAALDLEVSDSEENSMLLACLLTDLGTNLLFQAHLLSFSLDQGVGLVPLKIEEIYARAEAEFRRALELSPLYAPAWCGLGCSVLKKDPLLAQHAFCRCLELDILFPEAYANLSFLYTANGAFESSGTVSDALTQVADTPMMWINRALILERHAALYDDDSLSDAAIAKAADAYRAALQVAPKHPAAMIGLSVTCRAALSKNKQFATRQESNFFLEEFLNATSKKDAPSLILQGLSLLDESSLVRCNESNDFIQGGRLLEEGLKKLTQIQKVESNAVSIPNVEYIRSSFTFDETEDGKSEETEGGKSEETENVETISMSRRIFLTPNDGHSWLEFSKELIQELGSDPPSNALKAARAALQRAKELLMQQVTNPPPTSSAESRKMVDSRDLSDSLSLSSWMDRIDDREGGVTHCEDTIEVQCALILYPSNLLARHGLVN